MASGHIDDRDQPIFYVYAWYYVDSGEIFHIGKGKGNRYKETKAHRNRFFRNVIAKEGDNAAVKILLDGLTNDQALDEERRLIAEYKEIGQCKTNLHEGGCGGYTGKYDDPERSRKLSVAMSKRVGPLNSNYGHAWTDEQRRHLSDFRKSLHQHLPLWHKQKLIAANVGRIKTPEEIEKLRLANTGKKKPRSAVEANSLRSCSCVYEVFYDGEKIGICLGDNHLCEFCKRYLNLSPSIIGKVKANVFKPKFNRHKWAEKLHVEAIQKQEYDLSVFSLERRVIVIKDPLNRLIEMINDLYVKSKENRYKDRQAIEKHSKNQGLIEPVR